MVTDDPGHRSRRAVLAASAGLGTTLLAGCLGEGSGGETAGEGTGDGSNGGQSAAWRTTSLTRVRGDATFTIDGLEAPIVMQSFSVWCPKCERQSKALGDLPDAYTVVSLNTDPNEDAKKVRRHADSNGFDWLFAVSPSAMTDSLVDAFGRTVTNAPSTPLVVVRTDGSVTFDAGDVRNADEVESLADGA
jgi:hypothetical protein